MGKSPKQNEEQMDRVLNAWSTLAPAKSFGGMTLTQFRDFIAPAKAARTRITDLEAQLTEALNQRDDADEIALAKVALAIAGANGDPEFGPDSSLIEAMGRKRASERKTGLTRNGSKKPTGPTK